MTEVTCHVNQTTMTGQANEVSSMEKQGLP